MHTTKTLFLLILLATLFHCTTNGPSGPGSSGKKPLASDTIGPGGGTFGNEDFILTIPPGAFQSDCHLALHISDEENPFNQSDTSLLYYIEGIPNDFAEPLYLSMRSDSIPSDSAYIGVGRSAWIPSLNDNDFVLGYIPASDSSDFLSGTIPPFEMCRIELVTTPNQPIGKMNQAGMGAIYFQTFARVWSQNSDHFIYMHFPILFWLFVQENLMPAFEAAYDMFQDMDFYQSLDTEPMLVDLSYPLPGTIPALFTGIVDNDRIIPEFRSTLFNYSQENQIAVGHEYALMVGSTFFEYPNNLVPPWNWMNLALACWCEEKFTDESNYIPADFPGNEMAPFTGLSGTNSSYLAFGKGLSALFKYLTENYGDSILAEIYQKMGSGTLPAGAMIQSVPVPATTWWPDFFIEYVSGQIYNADSQIFLNSITASQTTVIDDTSDTKTFADSYADYSAKLYRIDLVDNTQFNENTEIQFSLGSSDIGAAEKAFMVFGLKDDKLDTLGFDNQAIQLNLRNLIEQDYQTLVIVVANSHGEDPYTDSSNINLDIKVKTSAYEIEWGRIFVNVWGEFASSYLEENTFNPLMLTWEGNIEFVGEDSLRGEWDEDRGENGYHKGGMKIKINPSDMTIQYFYAWNEQTGMLGTATYTILADKQDIEAGIYGDYQESDTDVCDVVTTITYHFVDTIDRTTDLVGYSCNTQSNLQISFHPDD